MSEPVVIRVEVGRRTCWIFGSGNYVVPALKLVRCARQWDDVRRGWMVSVDHVSDVLAALEHGIGGVRIDSSVVNR
jgi:hypothetical protein